ncbi:hypothetical protein EFL95_04320 [Nocardioides marmorisolisilvae]|uniref:DUF559 domain-containing protein n=2 Tax=Nocardioides marmorisolisilvae TaxID=1542737 RepID=A0A3N0DRS3_9ACTN|nr:hypothetical protein EFL95_04320 [Nocardioides marmorisolisilvae]
MLGVGYADGLATDGRTVLPVPVVVPPGTALRASPGIEVHRERLDPTDVTRVYGVPVTTGVRATFDAARRAAGLRNAVVAIDMAVAANVVTLPTLRAYLATMSGWTGLPQARRAAELADPRSLSPRETLLRLTWRLDAGLPEPRCNWPIANGSGRRIGRPDLLCEELGVIGEYDGADHRSQARHRDDLRRDDQFRAVGLEPFRVVGADLHDKQLVVARIRAAVERARASTTARTWLVKADPGPL